MITQIFLDSPVLCLFAVLGIAVVFLVVKIVNKINQNKWWDEYNQGLQRYANNPKERQVFVNKMTGTTQKQRDTILNLEEKRNDIVYKALKNK